MFDVNLGIPQSVQHYLSEKPEDRGIRMSVDALLKVGIDKVPPSLEWNELKQFYQARTAAELTRLEWSQAMLSLWQYIWGNNLNECWKVRSIEELSKNSVIRMDECWEDREFIVVHEFLELELFTSVMLDNDELAIGFGLEKGSEFLVKGGLDKFEWPEESSNDWYEWNVARLSGNILGNPVLIEEAKDAATQALRHCIEISNITVAAKAN